MTEIYILECRTCGNLGISLYKEKVIREEDKHKRTHDHGLVLHVIEPERSINL